MKTVWSKDSMPLVPPRYRSLYTVLLPSIDVGLIIFGLASLIAGSRLVSEVTVPWFADVWAGLVLAGALASLVCLAFGWLWAELWGMLSVGMGMLVYALACILNIIHGDAAATLTLTLVAIRVAAIAWRLNDLTVDIARQEADRDR